MTERSYIRVRWLDAPDDEPLDWWLEIDEARVETRKLVIYRDGRAEFASAAEETEDMWLGDEEVPTLARFATMPEFRAEVVSKGAFEALWERRHAGRFPAPEV